MPTTKYTLTSEWQLVATSAQEFIADNASGYNAQITFQAALPAANAAYHTLAAGQGITRMNLTGNLYARADVDSIGSAYLIISTS